jgi:TATA-binding protein-associated factor
MEGVKWLGFLVKYNLNGALCDDMGLGKTIQTLTVMSNEMFKKTDKTHVSLVIAPGTVVDHWYAETHKYISEDVLRPIILTSGVTPDPSFNLWLVTYT